MGNSSGVIVMVMMMFLCCVSLSGIAIVGGVLYSKGFFDTFLNTDKKGDGEPVCDPGDVEDYEYEKRVKKDDEWVCEEGWEDTGCGWDDGEDLGEKQCRKLKEDT